MKKKIIIASAVLASFFLAGGIVYYSSPALVIKVSTLAARLSAGLSRQEIKLSGQRWVYLDGGKGETILFLHGYGLGKDLWGTLLKDFSKSNRIIAPDLPGFGESMGSKSVDYGVPSQSARLHEFVTALKLQSFHVVGCSMGGGIAAWYASEHPDRVKSLVLIGPIGARPLKLSDAIANYEKDHSKGLFFKNREEFDFVMNVAYEKPPVFPSHIKKYLIELGVGNYDFNRKTFEDMWKTSLGGLEPRMQKISCPTLIIWGKNDRLLPVSCASVFNKGIKNSELVVLDCGHVTFIDEPVQTAMKMRQFFVALK